MPNFFALVILAFAIVHESISSNKHIKDHTIYKISSKPDLGVLTIGSESSDDLQVSLKEWHGEAGQKWKSKMPLMFKSYEFKPTSIKKAELDGDSLSHVYVRVKSGKDTRFWHVNYMGEECYQIENTGTKTCLSSQGLNKPTKLVTCDNSPAQQWIFKEL